MSGTGASGGAESRGINPGANAPATASDPSMEDILASIRRILSEDEQAGPKTSEPASQDAPRPIAEPRQPEVFNLDASMMVDEPAQGPEPKREAPRPEAPAPVDMAPPAANPVPESRPIAVPMPSPTPSPGAGPGSLVAPAAAAAAAMSLGSLRRTLETERPATPRAGGVTVEEMVREELRPVLKAWLDEHLAPIVERLVRAEIERVVGRSDP